MAKVHIDCYSVPLESAQLNEFVFLPFKSYSLLQNLAVFNNGYLSLQADLDRQSSIKRLFLMSN